MPNNQFYPQNYNNFQEKPVLYMNNNFNNMNNMNNNYNNKMMNQFIPQ